MTYRIEITKRARKQLERLPRNVVQRILPAIDALADTPRPRGCVPVKGGEPDTYRIRVGEYRIVYLVKDDILVVVVIRVALRREDTYKGL